MADINGTDNNDTLTGTEDADTIDGLGGQDTLDGGAGDDWLTGGPGADTLDGGDGNDFALYDESSAAVTIDLGGAQDGDGYITGSGGDAEGDRLKNIEHLVGTVYGDRLTGDSSNNWFFGGPGDDWLAGGPGADLLAGGAGADTLDGGDGTEDSAFYEESSAAVTIDLGGAQDGDGYITGSGGYAEGDRLKNIEWLFGSVYGDRLTGDSSNNWFFGGPGDDWLAGGPGGDFLEGGPGADVLDGGPGSDYASYQNSSVGVLVRLHNASAVKFGEAEGDTLTGIEHLRGSEYNDTLAGDGADNVLEGRGGDDVLYGGPAGGDDTMSGGKGDDRIFGGMGNDTLTGGEGNDVLKGGPGADTIIVDGDEMDVVFGGTGSDTFRFFPSDLGGGTIRDFKDGEDIIDLTQFPGVSSMDDLDIISHGDNVQIEVSGTDYLTIIILSDFVGTLDNSDFMF